MSKTILIQNNFIKALPELNEESKILYAPLFVNTKQKEFHKKRFQTIKQKFPRSEFCEEIDYQGFDIAYAWDAHYEKEAFLDKLNPLQNRLFDSIPFVIPNGFATFNERVQNLLPDSFADAITPIDEEVITHVKKYFKNPLLASNYFETRNGFTGSNYATGMSQFLSTGHLDVRYLYNEVKLFEKNYGSNKSTQWIIYELCWREYFYWHYQRHQLAYFSRAGIKGLKNFSSFEIYDFKTLHQMPSSDFFHAALNELEQTGQMSNRARQMFASFWINDLALDWRSGAMLFEVNLIDYDVYSNYGNWMYLAGVGVDPRGKRYFDIEKQLKTYDPENLYLKRWL